MGKISTGETIPKVCVDLKSFLLVATRSLWRSRWLRYRALLAQRICQGRVRTAVVVPVIVNALRPAFRSQRLNDGASNSVAERRLPPRSVTAGTASIDMSDLTLRMPP